CNPLLLLSLSHTIVYVYPILISFLRLPRPPRSTLFPYTTLFRSSCSGPGGTTRTSRWRSRNPCAAPARTACARRPGYRRADARRSEEHTSELQSRFDLVCRLLLEKKKKKSDIEYIHSNKQQRQYY